ncbi:MAG: penicillin-binding protein 2 [Nitrospirae bacterium]|nr:penicillin-binding protein 2 [Nitrospirota bacterium]
MQTEKTGAEKIIFISYLLIAGFVVVLLRLWQLQVLQGSELRKISESNRLRVIGVPAPRGIIFDRNRVPLVKNTPYFCASVIPQEFNKGSIAALSQLLNISEPELYDRITRKAASPFTPVRLREGLSFSEVSVIEARRSDFPGLLIEVETSREYMYGSVGSHLIGYLGKLNPAQSTDPSFKDVPPEAFIGQWGVEKLYDKTLRGTAGQRIIEVDAVGREIRLLYETAPVKGADLDLSIDIALQREAEKAFEGRAGALVALKTDTGEVLGLVSSPSFDPNQFAKGINYNDWKALMEDKKIPMLNRAIQSQYPPGSTFKILTAIAALEEGAIDTGTKAECRGGLSYGKWRFGCWQKKGHGIVSIHRALVESCDVFFYETGKRVGFDKVHDYAVKLGLGAETGIELGRERKGLIPNSAWKLETKKSAWFLGETFINSIGQGYVSATPIQLAVMMSAVANGGSVYKPLILKDTAPELVRKVELRQETLEIVRDALKGVVNESGGTGAASRSSMATVGGKTGTAQVVGLRKDSKYLSEKFRDHAWFVSFAPVEKPEIAMSVFVEHGGHGGSAAAPIAKKALEAYLLPQEKKKELLNVQN